MHRQLPLVFLVFAAAGLLLAAPAVAGDDVALREKVLQLEQKLEALENQQSTQLEQSIEQYLDDTAAWRAAQAGGDTGPMTVNASFTGVLIGTIEYDPGSYAVTGDVDLYFGFEITERLDLNIQLTAATGGNFPSAFGGGGGPTLSGLTDGIGVDGTAPVVGAGTVNVYQAFIVHELPMGDNSFFWEMGKIDPRTRFLQNAFADDENTSFINNLFDDTAAVLWLSNNGGGGYLGLHAWLSFMDDQLVINFGWFNTGTQFFDSGQAFVQVSWQGEVGGKAMNARLMFFYDGATPSLSALGPDDADYGFGISWDWLATEQLGLFARFCWNFEDVNPVNWDAQLGMQYSGLGNEDSALGFAFGLLTVNTDVYAAPKDYEWLFELYYRYALEQGKVQITPFVQVIIDPGAGVGFVESMVYMLGLRLHMPF